MDSKKLAAAVAEAKRFIERVQAWEKSQRTYKGHDGSEYHVMPDAVRRASMDLTRALADLRKP